MKSQTTILKKIKAKGNNYITINHYGTGGQNKKALKQIIELLTIQNELLRADLSCPIVINNHNEANPISNIHVSPTFSNHQANENNPEITIKAPNKAANHIKINSI